MAYFVTGATGFIGRHLVQELVDNRNGEIFVLVREGSQHKLDALIRQWDTDRVTLVVGDLQSEQLGVSRQWVTAHAGSIDHFFHLAAIYDMTASDEMNESLNVGGTRAALALADALDVGCFHQVSSIAAAGDYQGVFDETMFDEGQGLPSAYHRTKYESERIVRDEATVPWRVYRPVVVVGHSETGAMDKIDGPYYFFPVLKRLRDNVPSWVPLFGRRPRRHQRRTGRLRRQGDGPPCPQAGPRRRGVPPRQPGAAEHRRARQRLRGGRERTPVRGAARAQPHRDGADRPCSPARCSRRRSSGRWSGRCRVGWRSSRRSAGSASRPRCSSTSSFPMTFATRRTERALSGSGISVPDLESYVSTLWGYWEDFLDDSIKGDSAAVEGTDRQDGRDHRRVVGHRPGHRGPRRQGGRHPDPGRPRHRQAGGHQGADRGRRAARPTPTSATCPTSTRSTSSPSRSAEDFDHVDFVVNNAGRSIRRSLKLSEDRFHDFERTMQLNYFGAIRLIMGLLPTMRKQQHGHIVNISLDRRADQPAAVQRVRRLEGRARRLEQRGVVGAGRRRDLVHRRSTCRWCGRR